MAGEKVTCAEQAYHSEGNWGRYYPCQRKAGHGPEGKYCKQHAEKFADGQTVTWYRASRWTDYSCEISEVQVLSESEKTLLVKTTGKASREKKASEYYVYFPTRDEAIAFYERRAEGLAKRAEDFKQLVAALKKPAR